MKRVHLSDFSMAIIGFIGYLLIRFLALTIRFEFVHHERLRNLLADKGQRVIYCFWHDRLFMMPFIAVGEKVSILISQHKDGEYISRIVSWFGFETVRGSSTRGGSLALRRMIKAMRGGCHGAITPDGPKGPRHSVKDGALLLAGMTGAPLVPIAFSSSKKKRFPVGIAS
ncbi:MAG: lysophospholipid acyltransferase family protein [bacterium]